MVASMSASMSRLPWAPAGLPRPCNSEWTSDLMSVWSSRLVLQLRPWNSGFDSGRYNLQIKITSTSWILADEVCAVWYDIRFSSGVVNSLDIPLVCTLNPKSANMDKRLWDCVLVTLNPKSTNMDRRSWDCVVTQVGMAGAQRPQE